jgi:hypothetical protein
LLANQAAFASSNQAPVLQTTNLPTLWFEIV